MAGCNYDCASCKSKCEKKDFIIHTNELSNINKKIGIVSGKGGVGKSLVTSMLASCAAKNGYKASILDGDILGPSIPKMFGIKDKAYGDQTGKFIIPANGPLDIDVISSSMLLEKDEDPIIWRGSMVSTILKQFYTDVIYGEQDIIFIDMPPGTGDVPLTVFQSIPLDGIIIVTSPSDLVSMIVEKAVNMAKAMNIPILGIVENYAYIECPDCKKKIYMYGQSKVKQKAIDNNIKHYVSLPLNPEIATLVDQGQIYKANTTYFDELINDIMN